MDAIKPEMNFSIQLMVKPLDLDDLDNPANPKLKIHSDEELDTLVKIIERSGYDFRVIKD